MGSENNINDATSFQQSDKPILCANGCGFFGTAAMMNLCSKCYRDHRLREEQAAAAKSAVKKSITSLSPPPVTFVVEKQVVKEEAAGPSSTSTQTVAPQPAKPSNRCASCNKKVGVMGFECRCGSMFCGSHRYPEQHNCTFDFKSAGRDAIAKANPVVKADKLERF